MFWSEDAQLRQNSHPSGLHLWVEMVSGHKDAVQVWYCASFSKQNRQLWTSACASSHCLWVDNEQQCPTAELWQHMWFSTSTDVISKMKAVNLTHFCSTFIVLPGQKIPSPSPLDHPTMLCIFLSRTSSMRIKTGDTSYVNLTEKNIVLLYWNNKDFMLSLCWLLGSTLLNYRD